MVAAAPAAGWGAVSVLDRIQRHHERAVGWRLLSATDHCPSSPGTRALKTQARGQVPNTLRAVTSDARDRPVAVIADGVVLGGLFHWLTKSDSR